MDRRRSVAHGPRREPIVQERQAELIRCRCWDGLLPDDEGEPTITCPDCDGLGVVLDLGVPDALLWARAAVTTVSLNSAYDLTETAKAIDAALRDWSKDEAERETDVAP